MTKKFPKIETLLKKKLSSIVEESPVYKNKSKLERNGSSSYFNLKNLSSGRFTFEKKPSTASFRHLSKKNISKLNENSTPLAKIKRWSSYVDLSSSNNL